MRATKPGSQLRRDWLASAALGGAFVAGLALPAAAADVTSERLLNAAKEPQNWLMVHRTYDSIRYSTLDQINRDTVKNLKLAFAFAIGGAGGNTPGADNEGTPLVDDGIMFTADGWGVVYKVDVRSGRQGKMLWKVDPAVDKASEDRSRNRGLAFWRNTVINNTVDGRVMSLNRDTGEIVWEQKIARQTNFDAGEKFTTAPLTVEDKILVGQSAGDWGTRGWLASLDAATGKQIWRTYTIPGPGEPGHETWKDDHNAWKTGGGSLWTTGSYDPEQRVTIWGTGNPVPMFDPEYRPGDNLYTNSAIAFDITTGKIKWYYQYTPNESWDYDEQGVHLLFDATINGEARKVVGHFARNGYFYGLDRTNGQFVYGTQYVKEVTWTAGLDPKTGKPVEYDPKLAVQKYVPATRNSRSRPEVKVCPTILGGVRWQPTAYNPTKRLAYEAGADGCSTVKVTPVAAVGPGGGNPMGIGKTFVAGTNTSPTLHGSITAVDVTTGKLKARKDLPFENLSGVLATSGGLVFIGQQDGFVAAYNDETLDELWSLNVGPKFKGPPMTYAVNNKQYIAIMSGGANGGPGELANNYTATMVFVFAL